MGLGTTPDFEPRRVFPPAPNPGSTPAHLTPARSVGGGGSLEREEEARLVARSKAGDLDAFETLLRHTYRPVLRTTLAMTGNQQDAEDCVQNAMLNAYRGIGRFQADARFSTWLTRIAMNEVLQLRRRRQPAADSLDSAFAEDGVFRPRHVTAWDDNPEQLYAKAETRALVEQAMMKLPPPYRAAVLLRDFQQMTAEEAAAALNLEVANLKSRLHRGRLMLRELLAPVFARRDGGVRVSM
jgi:RNA polymerase sigma-70 factor (ECF subfamily)